MHINLEEETELTGKLRKLDTDITELNNKIDKWEKQLKGIYPSDYDKDKPFNYDNMSVTMTKYGQNINFDLEFLKDEDKRAILRSIEFLAKRRLEYIYMQRASLIMQRKDLLLEAG